MYQNNNSKNKIVKNSYSLNKNIIITGPNASGKTTLLKSTLFNIILSQQIGCGFFNSASVKIYDYIHCYINIPDTGGRDSLYQAEARQCKNILETNFTYGSHFSSFTGDKPLMIHESKGDLKLLHYKCLSYEYVVKKHNDYSKRRSEFSKKHGLGFHYDFGRDKILDEFNKLKDSSTQVI